MTRTAKNLAELLEKHGDGDVLPRPMTGEWRDVRLDATCRNVRQGGRVASIAAVTAVAVNTDGRREIVGPGTDPSEAGTFRTGLKVRGPDGVKFAVSTPHRPEAATGGVFDAPWRRCRVHRMGNALARLDATDADPLPGMATKAA